MQVVTHCFLLQLHYVPVLLNFAPLYSNDFFKCSLYVALNIASVIAVVVVVVVFSQNMEGFPVS